MNHVRTEEKDDVLWLVLDRPPVNALDVAVCHELADQFDSLASEADGGPVVLTGVGTAFSAGVDLKTAVRYDRAQQDEMLQALNRVFLAAYRFPRPLIGAINGHAIAGGLVLALTCDVRIGVEGAAQFGLAEVRVGIPYPVAAIEIVKAELGAMARPMVLLGHPVDARAALEGKVLDELCSPDELVARANAAATATTTLPCAAFAKIKRQLST